LKLREFHPLLPGIIRPRAKTSMQTSIPMIQTMVAGPMSVVNLIMAKARQPTDPAAPMI
jgi:hypothetical protein